ncbi:hypothetical protein AB3329_00310 [Streptococcus sp. H31]|uniref:hypothetical protein n=1 Tax=Streptococcus huangxiaojuni TaxID=3237239 RepID=UPI0034A2855C
MDKIKDLTVSNIHDKVIRNKTTDETLVRLFGKPDKQFNDIESVLNTYYEDNEAEGSTMDLLDDYTDYFDTEKYEEAVYDGDRFDCLYEYSSEKTAGVSYIRFYIKDGYIRDYFFGDITDESVAKKDKYLRQILD